MAYNTKIPGFMSDVSLPAIERLARKVPENGVIVEIGSFMGRSAWAFAKSAYPSVKVYCIDLWQTPENWKRKNLTMQTFYEQMDGDFDPNKVYDFAAFKENVKDCPNIIPIVAHSTENDWPLDKKADLVFVDGDHESPQVEKDIDYWLKRLKPNGILAGHDFSMINFPAVCRAVILISEKLRKPIKFFKDTSIWMIELEPSDWLDDDMYISNSVVLDNIKEVLQIVQDSSDKV